jgi:hypothetical protein
MKYVQVNQILPRTAQSVALKCILSFWHIFYKKVQYSFFIRVHCTDYTTSLHKFSICKMACSFRVGSVWALKTVISPTLLTRCELHQLSFPCFGTICLQDSVMPSSEAWCYNLLISNMVHMSVWYFTQRDNYFNHDRPASHFCYSTCTWSSWQSVIIWLMASYCQEI